MKTGYVKERYRVGRMGNGKKVEGQDEEGRKWEGN